MNEQYSTAIHLVTAVACLVLGAFVLSRNPNKTAHRAFAALALVLTLWAIGVALIVQSDTVEAATRWIRFTFIVANLLPLCFFYFIGVLSRPRFEGPRWFLYLLFALAVLQIAGTFTPWYIIQVNVEPGTPPDVEYGVVFYIYAVIVGLTMVMCYPILFRRLRDAAELERRQIEHVILGIAVLTTLASITNVVLPLFGVGISQIYGPIFIVGMLGFFAYAMVRYQLLDVRVIISRTAVYIVGFGFVLLTFFGAISLVHWVLQLGGHMGTILPTLLAALVITLVLEPLKESVRLLLDRTVLKRRYDIHQLLTRSTRNASRIVQLDELLDTICQDIRNTVGVSIIRVFMVDEHLPDLLHLEYSSLPSESPRPNIVVHGELVEYLRQNPKPIILKQLIHRRANEKRARLAKHLAELDAFLCLPLTSSNGLIGLITMGEKVNHDIYTSEDLQAFYTLTGPLVTAIENARLYRQLEEANRHRERILTTMRGAVIAVDGEGRITTINHAALELLGPIEIGQYMDILPHPVVRVLERTLHHGETIADFETTIHHSNGQTRVDIPVAMSSSPLSDSPGKEKPGAVVMIYDLQHIRRLEENVQRAHRLSSIGTLAAGMAHEIKNPLVSIKTFSQLLPQRFDDQDFRNTFMEVVPHEVDRIDSIVSQLLDFARPRPATYARHDLRDVIYKVLLLLDNQLEKANITVETTLPDNPLSVYADEQQVHQVFLNLVLNSIDAMRDTDERILAVTGRQSHAALQRGNQTPLAETACVEVQVADTGCGITNEELEGIFTPFFTTKEFGTGLGLSVVHGIVTEHGGQIKIESLAGKGTAFTVLLPVARDVAVAGKEQP